MVDYAKPIAESNNFIILDKYTKEWKIADSYQSEGDLEREFMQDLANQGYEHPAALNTSEALLANLREQLQTLNNVEFSDGEWLRFVESWLDKPSDSIVDKTRKIHDDHVHDFVFDDGRIQKPPLYQESIGTKSVDVRYQLTTWFHKKSPWVL